MPAGSDRQGARRAPKALRRDQPPRLAVRGGGAGNALVILFNTNNYYFAKNIVSCKKPLTTQENKERLIKE